MEFFRQEYWSRLPFPFPRDFPNPGIKPRSPVLQADFSLPVSLRKALKKILHKDNSSIFPYFTTKMSLLLPLLSRFSRVWLCATPWTAAHQAPAPFFLFGLRSLRDLSRPSRKGTSREWKLEPKPLDPLGISQAPILNRTRLWIFLKRQNLPECTSWTCTVQTKHLCAQHAVQEKGNCQTLTTLNPPKGGTALMNLVPTPCYFFFLFQFNSKVCDRNQTRTYTYTKPLKPGSPLGAACRCQPARRFAP